MHSPSTAVSIPWCDGTASSMRVASDMPASLPERVRSRTDRSGHHNGVRVRDPCGPPVQPQLRMFGIPVRIEPVFVVIVLLLGLGPGTDATLLAGWSVIVFVSVLAPRARPRLRLPRLRGQAVDRPVRPRRRHQRPVTGATLAVGRRQPGRTGAAALLVALPAYVLADPTGHWPATTATCSSAWSCGSTSGGVSSTSCRSCPSTVATSPSSSSVPAWRGSSRSSSPSRSPSTPVQRGRGVRRRCSPGCCGFQAWKQLPAPKPAAGRNAWVAGLRLAAFGRPGRGAPPSSSRRRWPGRRHRRPWPRSATPGWRPSWSTACSKSGGTAARRRRRDRRRPAQRRAARSRRPGGGTWPRSAIAGAAGMGGGRGRGGVAPSRRHRAGEPVGRRRGPAGRPATLDLTS